MAKAFEAASMVGSEAMIVPADGATDLDTVGIDPAGSVVRGGEAAGHPVAEPALGLQPGGDAPNAGAGLAFELHQVQLGNATFRPQIGRQTDLGEGSAVQVEGQAFDGAGAEVPPGNHAFRPHAPQSFGHARFSL